MAFFMPLEIVVILVIFNSIFYIHCYLIKCFLNVYIFFCTGFKIRNLIFICYWLTLLRSYTFIRLVKLIPNYHLANIFTRIFINRLHPSMDILDRQFIVKSKSQDYPACSLIICLGNILEPVLTCSISNLKFYPLAFNFNYLWHKVDSCVS